MHWDNEEHYEFLKYPGLGEFQRTNRQEKKVKLQKYSLSTCILITGNFMDNLSNS